MVDPELTRSNEPLRIAVTHTCVLLTVWSGSVSIKAILAANLAVFFSPMSPLAKSSPSPSSAVTWDWRSVMSMITMTPENSAAWVPALSIPSFTGGIRW